MALTIADWQQVCAAPQAVVAPDWAAVAETFFASTTGLALQTHITQRLTDGAVIYPAQPLRCLMETPLASVHTVILGQDPYHGIDKHTGLPQAEGLAFSVTQGAAFPPSLRNVFKERQRDLGEAIAPIPMHGSLLGWAHDGVLLLNTCLTVEDGQPASHAGRGWESLTDAVIATVAARLTPTVFMLWGAHAQSKMGLITAHSREASKVTKGSDGSEGSSTSRHLVLTANHPSPLSALRQPVPFIGCGHFGKARAWLGQNQTQRALHE
jgi:uracil-DNA glycosylase